MILFDQVEKSGSMSASPFSNTNRAEVLPSNKLTKKRVYLVLTLSVVLFVVLTLSLLLFLSSIAVNDAAATTATNATTTIDNSVKMTKQESFMDSKGHLNIIGVVDNTGNIPVQITVGLNTLDKKDDKSGVTTTTPSTMTDQTYGRIIYPLTGAPFKFVIAPNQSVRGTAFISSIKQVPVPYYNVLRLNYSSMPTGSEKALVGTVKNIGPFDLHDVSVYASVHDKNGVQIDSVKSNAISLIKPGEEVAFTAIPDSAISPHVLFFSCAGVSLGNAPMTILDIGKGQSISYDINGVVSISDFKYDNAKDSIIFGVKHYNPEGGPMSLKIVKKSGNPSAVVSVMMDGKLYNRASVKTSDPKTVLIDLFIPSGNHDVQVKGIRNA
ncbi:MAG TPA: FxLYD domain-containing protein [Nitrososphaeraceae archaeon]|nr:FxLYD domain-containing protein [Nitrososphaeraceae archaeon]